MSHIEYDIDMSVDNTGDEQVKETCMVYLEKDSEEMCQCDLCGRQFEFKGHFRFYIISNLGGNIDVSDTHTLITELEEKMMADIEATAIQNADLEGQLEKELSKTVDIVTNSEPNIYNEGEVANTNSEIKKDNDTTLKKPLETVK